MFNIQDKEDRQIRVILVAASALGTLAFLGAAVVVAVMVSTNFNFLSWME